MSKNQKLEKNKQLRELREKQQKEALAKKQREKRLITMISVSVVALILIVVGIVVLVPQLGKSKMSNYVSMTVKYTDDEGKEHTGDIIIELDPSAAPITVANFQKLVSEGFYNGLTFHRVIENFMIQGGDPDGNGTGGSDQDIKGEFSANGVNNPIKHERGVISMARSGEQRDAYGNVIDYGYDTASSQFFIVHETSPHLDGQYAAFGRVLSGMEFVDGIAKMATNSINKPLKDAIIVEVKLIEEP